MRRKPHIAVIGAGAFGGWTALHLLEAGARVTLLDSWGPGNSRASSGGETRIMRCAYGPDQPYTGLAARAIKLWRKYELRWKCRFLHRTGVLWMVGTSDDTYERGSLAMLRDAGIKFGELSAREMRKRWGQISFEGVRWGIYEPDCGYLDARASCRAVANAFVTAGGKYKQLAARSEELNAPMRSLALSDGSHLKADEYVFACGPWLGQLFPKAAGTLIRATKQDVLFFGPPAGNDRFSEQRLPVWADHCAEEYGGHFLYGIPGSGRRGFKVADDTRGPVFDPTTGERVINAETLAFVRKYIAFRFPGMAGAPLLESRVCQYEETPDGNFLVDRHPQMENVWLLGGGSGHGFKHGPVLGELVAKLILADGEPPALWRLSRFNCRS